MKAVNKGFTLIELMIVVAVIGVLAAIAIPQYQNYVVKSELAAGYSSLTALKTNVEDYIANNGTAGDETNIGAIQPADDVAEITANVGGTEASKLNYAYGNKSSAKLQGATLSLTKAVSDGKWSCSVTGVTGIDDQLPKGCTTVAAP
ncbi:MAG: pilin [Plesiomonas shigelloides]|uniref:pilin n=1 Tax=Plesiomonas shigelloides TaxID=703 RepID=UPI00057A31EE|nr:pilin [Plesiomonas shigelloides]